MNEIRNAANDLRQAIDLLERARKKLANVKEGALAGRVRNQITDLQETLDIIRDPECMPPGHDDDWPNEPSPYVWDGNRIEATKTVLFHEAMRDGRI